MPGKLLLLNLALILCCRMALAADRIESIRIVGNEVTNAEVILREMIVHAGDGIELDAIEESVQNIMDLGLFENVSYYLEQTMPDAGAELVIAVNERYYFYIIPTAKTNDDNQLEYGSKLIWHNVLGLNHTVKWKLLDAGSTAGVNEYKNQFSYSAPDIFASPYQFNLHILQDVFVDDDPLAGLQSERTRELIFDIIRRFALDGVNRDYYAGLGLAYRSRTINSLQVPAMPADELQVTNLRFWTRYDTVEEHAYNRKGVEFVYMAQGANDATGPNGTEFLQQEVSFRHYIMLGESPPRNFNYQFSIGTSTNDVLGDKAFNLGGNTNMRGYEIGTFRGNTQLYGSVEYLDTLYEDPLLRKALFADFGETVPRLSDINLGHLSLAVGAGIRWKLRKFVDFNLRLDLAYGFDTDAFRVAIGSKHAF